MSGRGRLLIALGVTLALVSPALRHVDSFPLSTYPMFAAPRSSTPSISTVVGLRADGERELLTPHLIGGDASVNLSLQTVERAIDRGRKAQRRLCRTVAERVASDPERGERIVRLEVVTERFDTRDDFGDLLEPRARKVHVRCRVKRR